MNKLTGYLFFLGVLLLLFSLPGCQSETDAPEAEIDTTATTEAERQPRNEQEQEEETQPNIKLEVSISDRELYVFRNGDTLQTLPVAVGSSEYPTPTGNFEIDQIDWNPDWTPPESEWTEGEEYTPPGHPDNPMGRVRMVYQSPYTIHGTEEEQSLGKAVSHGSIRVANEDAIELAKLVMEAGGADKPESWYDRVLSNPTEMETVTLEDPVPLTNKQ